MSSRRAQHLVFLAHVWACAPFLYFWSRDLHVRQVLGPEAVGILQPVIGLTVCYLLIRTWLAYRDVERLPWQYLYSPIDVAVIGLILYLSHRGPMSNITLLFFLPMIEASGALNVKWSAVVGVMVVVGTTLSTLGATDVPSEFVPRTAHALLQDDPLNSIFRIYFLVVLSSLMAYQSLIAAGLKERLGVAADRNRIAMEMHDGVQGHLIALSAQMELLEKVATVDGVRAAEIANSGRESVRQATDEIRFLVQRLRSPSLNDGFVSALRQFAHNICERHEIQLVFEVVGQESDLEPEIENAIFRIAQEVLTNSARHSGAGLIRVKVEYKLHEVRLSIADMGCGFDTSIPVAGVGLVSIKERAAALGGELQVKTQLHQGTCVETRIPL